MERNEGFRVQQTNIVVDVLEGYDREVKNDLNSLLGRSKTNKVLSSIQRTILNYEHCTFILDYFTLRCFCIFVFVHTPVPHKM